MLYIINICSASYCHKRAMFLFALSITSSSRAGTPQVGMYIVRISYVEYSRSDERHSPHLVAVGVCFIYNNKGNWLSIVKDKKRLLAILRRKRSKGAERERAILKRGWHRESDTSNHIDQWSEFWDKLPQL